MKRKAPGMGAIGLAAALAALGLYGRRGSERGGLAGSHTPEPDLPLLPAQKPKPARPRRLEPAIASAATPEPPPGPVTRQQRRAAERRARKAAGGR